MPDFRHEALREATPPDMKIFHLPVTQTNIEDTYDAIYQPISSGIGRGPIEFFIPAVGDEYIAPQYTLLNVKAKITNANGTNITARAIAPHGNVEGVPA